MGRVGSVGFKEFGLTGLIYFYVHLCTCILCSLYFVMKFISLSAGDRLPGGLVVRIRRSHRRGRGFDSPSGKLTFHVESHRHIRRHLQVAEIRN